MAHGNKLDYMPLWSEELWGPQYYNDPQAFHDASIWPGFPIDPAMPHPISVDVGKYQMPARPVPALGGRKTTRGVKGSHSNYVSLSNYNNIP